MHLSHLHKVEDRLEIKTEKNFEILTGRIFSGNELSTSLCVVGSPAADVPDPVAAAPDVDAAPPAFPYS